MPPQPFWQLPLLYSGTSGERAYRKIGLMRAIRFVSNLDVLLVGGAGYRLCAHFRKLAWRCRSEHPNVQEWDHTNEQA